MIILSGLLSILIVASPAPRVTEKEMGNVYVVEGTFEVAASREQVWSILTDYGSLPRFVTDVRSSAVTERKAGKVLVAQQATGKAAFIVTTVNLMLEYTEKEGQSITFRDVLKADFDLFEGTWTLTETAKGTRVSYTLRSTPRINAPRFIVAPAMEASTGRMLNQMQAEIEKRAQVLVSAR